MKKIMLLLLVLSLAFTLGCSKTKKEVKTVIKTVYVDEDDYYSDDEDEEAFSKYYYGLDDETEESSYIVYITDTGTKYHREDCKYLRYSRIEIDIEDAKLQGYEPCSYCNP